MIYFSVVFLLVFWVFAANKVQERSKSRINFIVSDDHACQAISAYDVALIQMSGSNRVAIEGILLSNIRTTNAICASLLQKTGNQSACLEKLHFGNYSKGFKDKLSILMDSFFVIC